MLGRKQELKLQFQEIVDGILLVLALWGAYVIRVFGIGLPFFEKDIPPFSEFRWLLFVIMPFGPIILELQGYYNNPLQKSFLKSLGQMARAAFWLCLVVGTCVIFLRLEVPSRSVLLMFGFLAAMMLLLREEFTRLYLQRRTQTGRFRDHMILVGVPSDVSRFRSQMMPDQEAEMEIVAEIDIEKQPVSVIVEALHRHSVSRVLFVGGRTHLDRVQEAIGACETEGVEAWLMADFIKTSIARPDFDVFAGRPMLVFRTTPAVSWALMIKGLLDWVGALAAVILLSWLFLFVAICIKLTSPGPIIFRQLRAGRHGKPFSMYKFRSMYSDAEMRRAELEALNQMSGPVFKVEDDPRVTRFGKWLRVTSVDELPQLFNVLQGHMSLVGPRPLPIYEVEKFENTAQRRRLSVKPGLTCLWQVSGRSDLRDFQDWVRLDLEYIDNWSIWLDLKILARTVPVVLFGFGAR